MKGKTWDFFFGLCLCVCLVGLGLGLGGWGVVSFDENALDEQETMVDNALETPHQGEQEPLEQSEDDDNISNVPILGQVGSQ